MVGHWVKQFEEGKTDVNKVERTGRPSDSMTIENIQQLRDLLEEDRRMTVSELCFRLQAADCAPTSVYKIVRDVLGSRKLAKVVGFRVFLPKTIKKSNGRGFGIFAGVWEGGGHL